MRHSTFTKLLAVLLVSLAANAPLYAACNKESCTIGPPIGVCNIIYDPTLDEHCSYWYKSSSVSLVDVGNPYPDTYAKFSGTSSGWFQQEVYVPNGGGKQDSISITLNIVNASTTNTGKLYVEIRQPDGALLETAGILTANSTNQQYSFNIDDYDGFYVKLHFRYSPGSSPGSTEFHLSSAGYFAG